MFNSPVTDQLSSLPNLDKPALSKLWRQLFKADPPDAIRKELLVQFLAYRLQEEEFGGPFEVTRRRIRELLSALEGDSASCGHTIKPGTRLVRQWKGQVHCVNVEEGNYEYRGARYESLSEIARLITGTRWSGPLFFGLKNRRTKNSLESA